MVEETANLSTQQNKPDVRDVQGALHVKWQLPFESGVLGIAIDNIDPINDSTVQMAVHADAATRAVIAGNNVLVFAAVLPLEFWQRVRKIVCSGWQNVGDSSPEDGERVAVELRNGDLKVATYNRGEFYTSGRSWAKSKVLKWMSLGR